MFRELGNLASLFKQAQQMGERLKQATEQLRSQRASGSAGGGMVEVEVNGLGEVLRVAIDPTLIERQEREMIEDLVPAAVNQAVKKAKELYTEALKEITGGVELPGMSDVLSRLPDDDGN